jgi:hypothetical protein
VIPAHRVSLAILFVPINRRVARAFICSLYRFADELIVAAQLREPLKSRAAPQKKLLSHAKLVSFAASIRNGRGESVGLPTG